MIFAENLPPIGFAHIQRLIWKSRARFVVAATMDKKKAAAGRLTLIVCVLCSERQIAD